MLIDSTLRITILRKIVHILLCSLLLIPFINIVSFIDPLQYYSILLVVSSILNSFIIKKPLLSKELRNSFEKKRRQIFETILNPSPLALKGILSIEKRIANLEKIIQEEISRMEREYEKKGGYIGIVYGIIGVLISYIFFKEYTFYGIIALMIIDPIAAIFGKKYGRYRVPITDKSVEGSFVSTLFFTIVLFLLDIDLEKAFVISFITAITELISIEDNLTIPMISSFLIFSLNSQTFF